MPIAIVKVGAMFSSVAAWVLGNLATLLGPLIGRALTEAMQRRERQLRVAQWTKTVFGYSRAQCAAARTQMPILGSFQRHEVDQILLRWHKGSGVLLVGEGGSGKTGIVAQLASRLMVNGSSVLILPTNALPPGGLPLGRLHELAGLDAPNLLEVLDALGKQEHPVALVIDQLENAKATASEDAVLSLLHMAAGKDGHRVLAVCRSSDAQRWPRLRQLGFSEVLSKPLTSNDVAAYLKKLGLEAPSRMLIELASNLLNLSFLAELVHQGTDPSEVDGEAALWDLYFDDVRQRDGESAFDEAVDLATKAACHGRLEFIIYSPTRPQGRLISRGILVNVGDKRYRFRHERMQDYLYAVRAVENHLPPTRMLDEVHPNLQRGVLQWIVHLYHQFGCYDDLMDLLRLLLSEQSPRHSFYAAAAALDAVRELDLPDHTALQVAKLIAKQPKHERYFLEHLQDARWLRSLDAAGVFARPPDPVSTGDRRQSFPLWPASIYLARVADLAPTEVVDICLAIHTSNLHIHEDLLRAASRMPPAVAARIVDRVPEWLAGAPDFAMIHELTADLMEYLAVGDEWDAALKLLAALIAPAQPPQPRPGFGFEAAPQVERWMLERIISGPVARLYRQRPFDVLAVLEQQLRAAIDLERESGRWGDSDGSFLWRRAIEESDQNHEPREYKELLVVAIRDILEFAAERPEIADKTRAYLCDEHSIFRRLAIHQIRTHPEQYRGELQTLFSDASYLRDLLVHHEFYLLMESVFGLLPEETQSQFLDVLTGEALQEYLDRCLQQVREKGEAEPDKEVVAGWRDHWLHPYLWVLRAHLPEPHHLELERLISIYGVPDHPEFLIWTGPVWTSARSEQGSEEDSPLSPKELMARVASAKPTDDPSEPPLLAFGSVLIRSLVADPESYVRASATFLDGGLPPMYWHHFLSGLQTAWQSGKDLDWELVVGFCEGVLAKAEEGWPAPQWRLEPDVDTTLGDVAWLLREGVVHRDRGIPSSLGPSVRDILLRLLGWQSAEPRDYSSYDPILHALNSRRGKVLHALVAYALWYARQGADQASGERMEPQVRDALTTSLEMGSGVDPVIHAIFGTYLRHLHYLDATWLEGCLPLIFPEGVHLERRRWASIAAHLAQDGYYRPLYALLRPQLLWAIGAVRPEKTGEHGDTELQRLDADLAQYLAGACWDGVESLHQDGVLPRFLAQAPLDARQEIMRTLSRWLDQTGQYPEAWRRLKDYWEQRLMFAELGPQDEDRVEEIAAFTEWLANAPEKLDALLPMVERTVAFVESFHAVYELEEYLAAQCSRYPREAARLLLKLVKKSDTAPFLRHPKAKAVLETALRSGDPDAREDAVAAINELGYRGVYAYRDLLDI